MSTSETPLNAHDPFREWINERLRQVSSNPNNLVAPELVRCIAREAYEHGLAKLAAAKESIANLERSEGHYIDALDACRAELSELRKDAERYRMMKLRPRNTYEALSLWAMSADSYDIDKFLDAAIDAASGG